MKIVRFINKLLPKRIQGNSGFLQFIPAIVSAGSAIYSATRKKPNSAMEDFVPPEYYEDPDYRKAQDFLRELGIGIASGDKIPDYYKGIGETGGADFENYLNLIRGDTERSSLEASAAAGRGGGRAIESATQAFAPLATEARYSDFLRALEGKKWLLNAGVGITEGVRGAGQQEGANRNTFNLKTSALDMEKRQYWDSYDSMTRDWENKKGQAIGSGLMGTLGAFKGGLGKGGSFDTAMGGMVGGIDWTKFLDPSIRKETTTTSDLLKKMGAILN